MFLPALISAVYFVYLLHQKFTYRTIFAISCVVHLFTLGGSSYYGLVAKIPVIKMVYDLYYSFFDTIKNGICFGLVYVSMGALFAERENSAENELTAGKAFGWVMLFAVLLAIEEFAIAYFNWNIRGVDTTIMLVPFTYAFMSFWLVLELNVSSAICSAMRKYSILLFLCQRITLSVIDLFMADTIIRTNSMLYFLTVLSVTFLIAHVLINASKKYPFLKLAF